MVERKPGPVIVQTAEDMHKRVVNQHEHDIEAEYEAISFGLTRVDRSREALNTSGSSASLLQPRVTGTAALNTSTTSSGATPQNASASGRRVIARW